MYDVVIIGSGPAGISASLYTLRANLKTLIVGSIEKSAMYKAHKIDNYYGFEEGISGGELLVSGKNQALRLGAEFLDDEVLSIGLDEVFRLKTSSKEVLARSVLLATGQVRKKADIKNLDEFEGKGVSYCTTCDGFFYRDLEVGVVGSGDFALEEARTLLDFTDKVTIFTNGKDWNDKAGEFKVNTAKILNLLGDDFVSEILFEDGSKQNIDGVFVAGESASSADFANKMGIDFFDNAIKVDNNQQTNIKGLFAAGDCTGGFKQIATAVGQGALAGKNVISFIKSL